MLDFIRNLNILLEGRRAVNERDIENEINKAIDGGYVISIQYKQKSPLRNTQTRLATSVRYVEPWGIGDDKRTGRRNVRVYQVKGDSTSKKKTNAWKTISLDSIINCIVLDGKDGTGEMLIQKRPDFKQNDTHIDFYNYVGKNQVEPQVQPQPEKEPHQVQPEPEPLQPEREPEDELNVVAPQNDDQWQLEPENEPEKVEDEPLVEPDEDEEEEEELGALQEAIRKIKKLIVY